MPYRNWLGRIHIDFEPRRATVRSTAGHQASAAPWADIWHRGESVRDHSTDAAGPAINPLIKMPNIVAIMIISLIPIHG
jgi:Na+/H+-translocating membrane pyrophosphatase